MDGNWEAPHAESHPCLCCLVPESKLPNLAFFPEMFMVFLYPSLFLKMSENDRKLSTYLRGGNENIFFHSYTDSRTDLIFSLPGEDRRSPG